MHVSIDESFKKEKRNVDPFAIELTEKVRYDYYKHMINPNTFAQLTKLYPKYDRWVVEAYMRLLKDGDRRDINLFWEDLPQLKEYLELFEKAKNKRLISGRDADIMRLKTVKELKDLVLPFWDQVFGREAEEEGGKADKVYDKNGWLVVIPRDQEASCKYGANTRWCTASKSSKNYFDHYNDDGPLYIIIDRNSDRKFQFHGATDTYMDENDDEISLREWILFPEDLKQFLYAKHQFPFGVEATENLRDMVGWGKHMHPSEWAKRYDELFSEEDIEKLVYQFNLRDIRIGEILNDDGLAELKDAVRRYVSDVYLDLASEAYSHGWDNPELWLDQPAEDEDEEGEPLYSEEQKEEAAMLAEKDTLEQKTRDVLERIESAYLDDADTVTPDSKTYSIVMNPWSWDSIEVLTHFYYNKNAVFDADDLFEFIIENDIIDLKK